MSDVLVTGGSGMVGSALKELYPSAKYLSSKEYDLRSSIETRLAFQEHRPRYVVHLAAKVGGVKGNSDFPSDFFTENSMINTNVIDCCVKYNVKRVVSLLSTCVYPDSEHATYPLTEEQMHAGPPHESNFAYAHVKRMLEVHSRAARKQHGLSYACAIPNNIYGNNDNYDLENGHVVPAIIRKVWEAKHKRKDVHLWGDGSPLREFTHASDIARALLFLLWTKTDFHGMVNIGTTQEHSIKEIAKKIAKELGYSGNIIWDADMPSGQHRKPSSNAKFIELGWEPNTYLSIDDGLKQACDWFKNNYPYVRGVENSG